MTSHPKKPEEPIPEASQSADDDRTQFAPVLATAVPWPEDDHARFVAGPAPISPAPDVDRTRFAAPAAAPPPEVPEDRTRFAGVGSAAPSAFAPPNVPPPVVDMAELTLPPPLERPLSAHIPIGSGTVTVGTLINNNYQITHVLKSGGMGEVFRGVEIGTGDPVAIKAVLTDLAEDEKASLLFKREAKTLRQLSDEAIVRYYNYVHDRDLNRYFLVMEFVEGVSLKEHVATHGAIAAHTARTLLRRLAKGLSKAHAQGVIHRDLSPDNVMLPGGVVAEARLIDFGIAKSNVVKEGTMAGQFAGKFKYVAPEQLGAFEGTVTPATDVYGLALLICVAVVGQPLNMGSNEYEAVSARMAIPDLSAVSAELRPLLAFMLEPDPRNRPRTLDDVLRYLERPDLIPARYLDGLPVPPPLEDTQAFRPTPVTQSPVSHTPTPGLQVPGGIGQTTQRGTTPWPVPPAPEERADASGSRLLLVMGMVFVAILGGAGWYASTMGLVGVGGTPPPRQTAEVALDGVLPAVQIATRDGFLATYDLGLCSFATRLSSGQNAGMIEGYSAGGTDFFGLPAAYEVAFGTSPEILPRGVSQAQCAALDFVRALQGRAPVPVQLLLSADRVASGETVTASVSADEATTAWTVLITPLGEVYNLTDRLSEPADGQQSVSFGLQMDLGKKPAPQLLLAVSADQPLTRAAAMRDGARAADLLPAVLQEITARGGGASATVGWVLLTPAAQPASTESPMKTPTETPTEIPAVPALSEQPAPVE